MTKNEIKTKIENMLAIKENEILFSNKDFFVNPENIIEVLEEIGFNRSIDDEYLDNSETLFIYLNKDDYEKGKYFIQVILVIDILEFKTRINISY